MLKQTYKGVVAMILKISSLNLYEVIYLPNFEQVLYKLHIQFHFYSHLPLLLWGLFPSC